MIANGQTSVGLRADLIGFGGRVESSVRLPIVTVPLSGTLDDFLARFRKEIEPLWNGARVHAAMNGFYPECLDMQNGCSCYFWKKQNPPLCAPCAQYGDMLNAVRVGGDPHTERLGSSGSTKEV